MRAQNNSIGVIESVVKDETTGATTYYAMVGAISSMRDQHWTTTVQLSTAAFRGVTLPRFRLQQYRMNSSMSATETVLRELKGQSDMLQKKDGLPYAFNEMLTAKGMEYAEKNIDRLWAMHAGTFRPRPFEGAWQHDAVRGRTSLSINVTDASVTVVSVTVASQ